MKRTDLQDWRSLQLAVLILVSLSFAWIWALFFVTEEANQGEVYRILYVHVPCAFASFFSAFYLFCSSLLQIYSKKGNPSTSRGLSNYFSLSAEDLSHHAEASAEVGLLFTMTTLLTGALWGKPTWGTWWTWDARLTTTFLLSLLFGTYLILSRSIPSGPVRRRACAVLGILIFADVPIIYKSVSWWRTLHQAPSLVREGGSTMDSEILVHLTVCIVLVLCLVLWQIRQRAGNLKLEQEQDRLERGMLSSQ
ncbi:MAG: cytochrome c biogenesis protein CcsA [Oligoflexales bacterium]|nr:cytochrome c biogenesis protein CcsA [Oligoflexales bacterium]